MIHDDQNSSTSLDLQQIRDDIDSVDQQIQELINRRASLAEAVAKAKFAAEENPLFYRPEREAQVLRRVMERNKYHYLIPRWHVYFVKSCRLVWHLKHRKALHF